VPSRSDIIRTDRLLMRGWRDSDREPFAALNADPETMRFYPATMTRAESDAFARVIETRMELRGFGLWALELAETAEFIGFTGLNPLPDGVPNAGGMEIAWRLARPFWHHGYATEAAMAAVDVAFGAAGLPEIWSMTAVLNVPSVAVMKRIGMAEFGHFDHPRIPVGDPLRSHVMYGLRRPR
jgi:RimJ/RimL family protein N-acetyltransferase